MSAHLPRRIPHIFHQTLRRQCLFQQQSSSSAVKRQPFSSSTVRGRKAGQGHSRDYDSMEAHYQRMQGQQQNMSPKAAAAANAEGGPVAASFDDLGILPGTFIRTSLKNLPSLFSQRKERFEYEWNWLKTRIGDFAGRMNYKFWLTKKRPRPKLARRPVVKAAKQLHESIFTEFSNRDDRTLKSLCTSGLLTTFRKQLASLPKDEMMSWRLLKHLSRPRIVSNRATPLPLPGDSEAALRQVVVRLHTRQLVEKWETQKKAQVNVRRRESAWTPKGRDEVKKAEETKGGEGGKKSVEKDVVEYVVLQRIMRRGKEEDWKVWGFANETTYQELKEEQKRIEQMSEWEARHG